MSTLTVGPGQEFSTLASAVAASGSGDTIQVQAGNYVNDFAELTHPLTIEGIGGMAHFIATEAPPNQKAILTTDADATVSNLEFSGAFVPGSGNGAGIRQQGGNLTLNDDYFHNNEDGVLVSTGNIVVNNSEFGFNGAPDGQEHNLYVDGNGADSFAVITGSYFHDNFGGHEIKSRAQTTIITNNRIQDQGGATSYSIDLPQGGNALVQGNVIEKGPGSVNWHFLDYGAEDNLHPGALTVSGNTILNDSSFSSPPLSVLLNFTNTPINFSGNSVYGVDPSSVAVGPANVSGNTFLSSEPSLDSSHPFSVLFPTS